MRRRHRGAGRGSVAKKWPPDRSLTMTHHRAVRPQRRVSDSPARMHGGRALHRRMPRFTVWQAAHRQSVIASGHQRMREASGSTAVAAGCERRVPYPFKAAVFALRIASLRVFVCVLSLGGAPRCLGLLSCRTPFPSLPCPAPSLAPRACCTLTSARRRPAPSQPPQPPPLQPRSSRRTTRSGTAAHRPQPCCGASPPEAWPAPLRAPPGASKPAPRSRRVRRRRSAQRTRARARTRA